MSDLTAHCELLTLKKEDFNNVLKETIKARWDEIRDAMKMFNYFDYWDEITISECCIISKIKTYEQNQIILGDGMGKSSQVMVYFVIEGKCAIVEHLFVVEKIKRGIKTYKLYEPPPPPASSTADDEVCGEKSEIVKITKSSTETSDNIGDTEIIHKEDNNETDDNNKNSSESSIKTDDSIENEYTKVTFYETEDGSIKIEATNSLPPAPVKSSIDKNKFSLDASFKNGYPTIEQIKKFGQSQRPSTVSRSQRKTKTVPTDNLPEHVKVRFMQVCTLGEKSTFTNNNLLNHRRVIALTPVKCILIPKYWLIQHNKGNVWTRVMKYFEWRMPTHEEVFKQYVAHKKWNNYKKSLVADILQHKKFVNNTTIHDIPYSIRIMNEMD